MGTTKGHIRDVTPRGHIGLRDITPRGHVGFTDITPIMQNQMEKRARERKWELGL